MLKIFQKKLRLFQKFGSNFLYRQCSSSEITAGIVIIGDEILNGVTADLNSNFLIKNLNSLGLKINKLCILPDDIDIIADEVAVLSEKCTVVLTTGGVGPTHDDVTFEAISKAFGDPLKLNEELITLFKYYFGPDAGKMPAVVKFASIPQSATLNFEIDSLGKKTKFPLISIKNVYVFPGVPSLLQKGFEVFKANFLLHNKPFNTKNIFLNIDEFTLTPILNEAVNIFKEVKFGSYPTFQENYYKVKLVLECKDEMYIHKASTFICGKLPKTSIVIVKDNMFKTPNKDYSDLVYSKTCFQEAVSVIEEALGRYSLSELAICFNGGKDCTTLLHLVYNCVQNQMSEQWHQLNTLYIKNEETFDEIEDFIQSCTKNYNLKLVTVTGDVKESVKVFLQTHPHIKAVFMGTRSSDLSDKDASHFSHTDQDWPSVMRIYPILNWSYRDVWYFIRSLQLPYCTLYDRGYSSLGIKSLTRKNPALLISNEKGFRSYKSAYLLDRESEYTERSGR